MPDKEIDVFETTAGQVTDVLKSQRVTDALPQPPIATRHWGPYP
jgi:hypothetical protein